MLFKTDLDELFESSEALIPRGIAQLIEYIELEGGDSTNLFQAPDSHYFVESHDNVAEKKELLKNKGYKARVHTIKKVKKKLHNSTTDIHQELVSTKDIHVASAVLKIFLSHLPDSLLPRHFFPKIERLMQNSQPRARIVGFRSLIFSLSDAHDALLRRLMQCFHALLLNSSSQVLSSTIIASSFGPIAIQRKHRRPNDFHDPMLDTTSSISAFKFLIDFYEDIFTRTNDQEMAELEREKNILIQKTRVYEEEHTQLVVQLHQAIKGKHRAILMKTYEKRLAKSFQCWRSSVAATRLDQKVQSGIRDEIRQFGMIQSHPPRVVQITATSQDTQSSFIHSS